MKNQLVHALTRAVRHATVSSTVPLALILLSASGCTDGRDASAPLTADRTRLNLRAAYAAPIAYSAPINRIRLTVRFEPSGPTLPPFTFPDLDPNQDSWTLPVEFDLQGTAQVTILAELINFANGVETVEFSGKIGPLTVSAGDEITPSTPLQVFPGKLENLDITDIQITAPAPVTEGDQRNLVATVQGGGSSPMILWSSLDPTLATVDATGRFQALLPGTARIVASAGPRADTLPIAIARRIDRVVVTPPSITLTTLGANADYTAQVQDPRGGVVTGAAVVWSIDNPAIADEVSPGRYRSKAAGQATITAALQANPSIKGTATLIVQQTPARVTISPTAAQLQSLFADFQFTATVTDVSNNPIANPTLVWTSSVPGVATVSDNGVATSRGSGRTIITVRAGTLTATATLDVVQLASRIEISPTQWTFTSTGQQKQFTASAVDANDQPVAEPISWSLESQGTVIEVSSTGLVTSVGPGTALVIASAGGMRATAAVSVNQPINSGPVSLIPKNQTFVSNCIPFGDNVTYQFTGVMYRNVPSFTLNVGDRIAFDLGAPNGQDVRRDIYMSAANKNPTTGLGESDGAQGIRATTWVQVVSENQIPLNPRGDQITGNYELMYTAEAPFTFAGGGLIVGFAGSPPAKIADGGCDQVLVTTTSADSSGYFYGRFFHHQHLTTSNLDVGGFSDAQALGGMRILKPPFNNNPQTVNAVNQKVIVPRPFPADFKLPGLGPGREPPPPVRRPPSKDQ